MRYIQLLVLSILVVSCHNPKVSDMEQYQSSKNINNQNRTSAFDKTVADFIQGQKQNGVNTPYRLSVMEMEDIRKHVDSLKTGLAINDPTDKALITPDVKNSSADFSDKNATSINHAALLLKVRDYAYVNEKVHELSDQYKFRIITESEHTTDFHKGNTVEIQTNSENFTEVLSEFNAFAIVLNKKNHWKQNKNNDFLTIKSLIESKNLAIAEYEQKINNAEDLKDKLLIQKSLNQEKEDLNLLALKAENSINSQPVNSIILSFYQDIEISKPQQKTFTAEFSANFTAGGENFKQFLLETATVWPYVLIGLLFFITALLAVGSSRKKARQFKLQMLHHRKQQHQFKQLDTSNK